MSDSDIDRVDAGERYYRETTTRLVLFELTVEVREDGLYLRFSPLHRSFRRIPLADVDRATTRTYDSATYGGWHWGLKRTPGGNRVYRLRGDQGVELALADGRRVFIGSQTPGELKAAIERATTPE
jgi:hypothetical protein